MVARTAGMTGDIVVTGAGSAFDTAFLALGEYGDAQLDIADGGVVDVFTYTYVGVYAGSSGDAHVSGAGSALSVASEFHVGVDGTGALTVDNGGAVNTGTTFAVIGTNASGVGTALVTGAGSTWTHGADLYVAYAGEGQLTIADGGVVSSTRGYLGGASTGEGSVLVTGVGSLWTMSQALYVGESGVGALSIEAGGHVANQAAFVGYQAGANGEVNVNGGTWANAGQLTVGSAGLGQLSISLGGVVTASEVLIGSAMTGDGQVTILGTGSAMNTGTVFVGVNGDGEFSIADGAVTNASAAYIGLYASSTGSMSVTGVGSSWMGAGSMIVGNAGSGELLITGGGHVQNADVIVGFYGGSSGHVVVDGATWDSMLNLVLGYAGDGVLEIINGGVVTAEWGASIGADTNGSGTAYVSGSGSLWANNALLDIGVFGAGTLQVVDGAEVSATSGVRIAIVAGSTGTLIIGGDGAPAAAGSITTPVIEFGAGDGEVIFNHTSTSLTFATPFNLGGATSSILFSNGTTLLTGNSSGYAGTATIDTNASAYFNNLFGGAVTVNAGGLVGGDGSIGALTALSGGIVSPGDGLGALTVTTANFNAGSIFLVDASPTAADHLIASGAVTISGGAVQVLAELGVYDPITTYTILTGASVTGTFSSVTDNLAFLDPTLLYDASHVYLRLTRNDILFVDVAQTPNQVASANAIDGLGMGDPLWNAFVGLSAAQAQAGFDGASGEFHASLNGGGFTDPLTQFALVNARLIGLAEGPSFVQLASLAAGGGQAAQRGAVWGQVSAGFGQYNGDGNAHGLEFTQQGVSIGADAALDGGAILGAALFHRQSEAAQDPLRSSADISSTGVSIYGGVRMGALSLSGDAGFAWRDISSERRVLVGPLDETLTASYGARAAHAQVRLGIVNRFGDSVFEPFVALSYVQIDTDGFTEDGGSAALARADQSDSVLFSTLGVRLMQEFGPEGRDGALYGVIGWRHAEGDILSEQEIAFASNPGVLFEIAGTPLAEDILAIEAGLRLAIGANSALIAAYRADLSEDGEEHAASLRLSIRN